MPIPKKLPGSGGAIGTSSAGVPSSGQDTKVLLGRYSVGRHLGSGNFGSVYLVTDMKDYDRFVSIIYIYIYIYSTLKVTRIKDLRSM